MAGRKRKPEMPSVSFAPVPTYDAVKAAQDAKRPRVFDLETGTRVCHELACGRALAHVLREPWAPTMGAFLRWLSESDELARIYARARETCADVLADQTIEISDRAIDSDSAAAARVQVAARQWYAAKLKPKVYGDNVQLGLGAADGGIVINLGRFVSPTTPAIDVTPKSEDAGE